jgi:NRPS condensation-like uncharacterized protein
LEKVQKKAKEMKMTINDLIMGVTSMSIKEYMESKGDDKTSEITIGAPFTLRDPILRKHGFKFENNFEIVPLNLSLCSNFETAIKLQKQMMDKLKRSLMPTGTYFLRRFFSLFIPGKVMKRIIYRIASKYTFGISNLPGPSPTFKFNGLRITKCMFLIGGMGDMTTGFTFMSMNGIIK